MIIDEVLELLKKSKYKIYQGYARSDNECIVYSLEPITSDKIKEQWRLKTTCISNNFEKALEMNENLKELL